MKVWGLKNINGLAWFSIQIHNEGQTRYFLLLVSNMKIKVDPLLALENE